MRRDVAVVAPDGVCPSIVITPEGPGPWPAVIVFPDAGGVRPAVVDIAEDLAAMGYVAFLPEMYYRYGGYEPFRIETAFTDPGERERLTAMATSVTVSMAVSDAGAFLDFLMDRPEVAGTKVGTVGYCMGGRLSLAAAGHHPDHVAAAASVHGGQLATEDADSPHRSLGSFAGRLYVAAARDDASFPPEQAHLLEQALTEAGVDHTIEIYSALHGFAVSDNPTYDPEAAARHRRALAELFEATLPR